MVRCFRFLLSFVWVNLGATFAFAGIVIAGCIVTGVPHDPGRGQLFANYYAMFPAMLIMILFLYAFALCTSHLNLGLSMGARRSDFFWAMQGCILFYSAVCWGLQLSLSALPELAGWTPRELWGLLRTFQTWPWGFPLVCAVMMVLGCLCGILVTKNRSLGVVLTCLFFFVMIVVTVYLFLSSDAGIMEVLLASRWSWLWTALPRVLLALAALGAAGGELLLWRFVQRYVVR